MVVAVRTPSWYPRIGYAPISSSLKAPGDRRRFVAWATRRSIPFEIAEYGESYDLVVLTQMADISHWVDWHQGKIAFDFIDSYLAVSTFDPRQMLRGLQFYLRGRHRRCLLNYRRALEQMCARADIVICSTQKQKTSIARFAREARIILDCQDSEITAVKCDYERVSNHPTLLWEGLGQNLRNQLLILAHLLEGDSELERSNVIAVTDDIFRPIWGLPITLSNRKLISRKPGWSLVPWSSDGLVTGALRADVGIIPVDLRDPMAAGKPINKLLLMWRLGLPVVTSSTPAYSEAMQAIGFPELACKTTDDWRDALREILRNDTYRQRVAKSGREFAALKYSDDCILSQWDDTISRLANFNG